jgi:hypothetical protein
MKMLAIPRKRAFISQSCSREKAAIPVLHLLQRLLEIVLRHDPARKISTHDKVVDILEKLFDPRINLIQVGNHRNTRGSRPPGRKGRSSSIVTIDVKRPRIHDPLAIEICRLKHKPLIASAQDRPFATRIDKDE